MFIRSRHRKAQTPSQSGTFFKTPNVKNNKYRRIINVQTFPPRVQFKQRSEHGSELFSPPGSLNPAVSGCLVEGIEKYKRKQLLGKSKKARDQGIRDLDAGRIRGGGEVERAFFTHLSVQLKHSLKDRVFSRVILIRVFVN